MKRIIIILFATSLLTGMFSSCKENYTVYSDAEYVLFSDTLSAYMVSADQEYFTVPVASTVACDYDRTFGVEVVDKGSNAIERFHYRLLSNTFTIKAGELASEVRVKGLYDNIENTDSLGFILRLVMPDNLRWDLYTDNNQIKVLMMKSCPYQVETFTGWCVVSSLFLYDYPGLTNASYQRLIRTEAHPTELNKIILRNWLFDGYDVTMNLDPSDLASPLVTMDEDQLLSNEELVFGQIHGDNKLRVTHSTLQPSYFNSCQKYVSLWIKVSVSKMGDQTGLPAGGVVGHFFNTMEWVSDEEAARLQREEGM